MTAADGGKSHPAGGRGGRMASGRRRLAWTGIAGSVVGFGTTLLATVLSPSFSWTANALSDLGAPTAANPWLFNGGLVAAGLVSLPFAWVLFASARHLVERLGAAVFAATVADLALIGAFPEGTALHFPLSVGYFTLLSFALWIYGSGTVLAGDARRGLAAIWLGLGNVLVWVLWSAFGTAGVAIPEILGSIVLLTWVVQTTQWVRSAPHW